MATRRPLVLNSGQAQQLQSTDSVYIIVDNGSSAPGSPVTGQMYFDTTLNQMCYYNGTVWVTIPHKLTTPGRILATKNFVTT